MRRLHRSALCIAAILAASTAAAAPPAYSARFLGPGYPAAMNARGDVAGVEVVGSNYRPWVSLAGAGPITLPLPAGYASAQPAGMNGLGAIAGQASANVYAAGVPVLWTQAPDGSYSVEVLPVLGGDLGGAAAAVNDLGEVVGTRAFRGITGVVFSAPVYWGADRTPVDLMTTGFTQFPVGVNAAGQVVGGGQRLDLRSGVVQELGVPTGGTTRYNFTRAVAINARGDVAATVITATSQGYQRAARWRDGEAWRVLAGLGLYDGAVSLNAAGDVGMVASFACATSTARTAVLYLEGDGTFCLSELLDAASRSWIIPTGTGPLIDDARRVAVLATNPSTGAYGTVLLTPVDAVPPVAPTGLTATPVAATWQQPYHQIQLRWTDNAATELAYLVERRDPGAAAFAPWQTLARDAVAFSDTQLAAGANYQYRVKALGLAGDSGYSNVATATAPSASIDRTPPTLALLSPAQGAAVTGVVTVSVTATDDVGVTFLQVVAPTPTGEAVLCSTSTQSSLSCAWDTRSLAPGVYSLQIQAADAMNNGTLLSVTVTVTASASTMRCSSLTLGGTTFGSRASPRARATLTDPVGRAVRGAQVSGSWTRPDGSAVAATATTDSRGQATFSTSGPRGTWTFTVAGSTRAGYRFDAASSVTRASRVY